MLGVVARAVDARAGARGAHARVLHPALIHQTAQTEVAVIEHNALRHLAVRAVHDDDGAALLGQTAHQLVEQHLRGVVVHRADDHIVVRERLGAEQTEIRIDAVCRAAVVEQRLHAAPETKSLVAAVVLGRTDKATALGGVVRLEAVVVDHIERQAELGLVLHRRRADRTGSDIQHADLMEAFAVGRELFRVIDSFHIPSFPLRHHRNLPFLRNRWPRAQR